MIVLAPSLLPRPHIRKLQSWPVGETCPSSQWGLTEMVMSQLCLGQEATAGLLRGTQPEEGKAVGL